MTQLIDSERIVAAMATYMECQILGEYIPHSFPKSKHNLPYTAHTRV